MIDDRLIDTELLNKRLIGRGIIIPLDHHAREHIDAGFYTAEFVRAFLSEYYAAGETDNYTWMIRRVDQLINLRIWRKGE